jgi:hypothetical protein
MFRTCLLICSLAVALAAQTADPSCPLELSTRAAVLDANYPEGTSGFALDVKNVSARDIRSYTIRVAFTDPTSGKGAGNHVRIVGKAEVDKTVLAAGGLDPSDRPITLPHLPSGVQPTYALSVDYVIFSDGSTWGPGTYYFRQLSRSKIQP